MNNKNKVHREVELQSNLKMVITLIAGLFSSEAQITEALHVINTVAGQQANLGFWRPITGNGTILGNVMVLDLNIPLMDSTTGKGYESAFNNQVARALNAKFGRANVGYVSSEPVVLRAVTIETDKTNAELEAVLPKGTRLLYNTQGSAILY